MKLKENYKIYLALFVWCFIVFYISNKITFVSRDNTMNILSFRFGYLSEGSLDGLNSLFREGVHVIVYCILGILSYNVFGNKFILSLCFCVWFVIANYLHQYFAINQSIEILNIMLSFYSVLTGISLSKFVEITSNDCYLEEEEDLC